jgi:hypothetical protein
MHNNTQQADDGSVRSVADASIIKPSPSGSQGKRKQGNNIPTVPPHIFTENVRPTTVVEKLPEPDERLTNTPLLACCLVLLKDSQSLDSILKPVARNWLQVVENDTMNKNASKSLLWMS